MTIKDLKNKYTCKVGDKVAIDIWGKKDVDVFWSDVEKSIKGICLGDVKEDFINIIDEMKIDDERTLWDKEEISLMKKISTPAEVSNMLVNQKIGYNQALTHLKNKFTN